MKKMRLYNLFAAGLLIAMAAEFVSAEMSFFNYLGTLTQKTSRSVLVVFVSKNDDSIKDIDDLYRAADIQKTMSQRFVSSSSRNEIHQLGKNLPVYSSSNPDLESPQRGVIRLSIEDYLELADQLGVRGAPTFLIISPTGEIIKRAQGIPRNFAKFITEGVPIPGNGDVIKIEPSTNATSQPSKIEDTGSVVVKDSAVKEPVILFEELHSRLEDTIEPDDHGTLGVKLSRKFRNRGLWIGSLHAIPDTADLDLEILGPNSNMIGIAESPDGRERLQVAVDVGIDYSVHIYSLKRKLGEVSYVLSETFVELPSDRIVPSVNAIQVRENSKSIAQLDIDGSAQFRFSPIGPGTYKISVNPGKLRSGTVEIALVLPSGEILQKTHASEMYLGISSPEPLVLAVLPMTGKPTGEIQAEVTRITSSEPPKERRDGPTLELDVPAAGILGGDKGDHQTFKFIAPTDGQWEFVLIGENNERDVDLELFSSDGKMLRRSETSSARETIKLVLNQSETIFVRAFAYRSEKNTLFTIEVKLGK
ncbi:MAG: hypothetical protein JKX97_06995 [Candidatus Lindowbacteria bacterium]|nr:hypothetical protein [Candidatus Lindowbacteria bacterium]